MCVCVHVCVFGVCVCVFVFLCVLCVLRVRFLRAFVCLWLWIVVVVCVCCLCLWLCVCVCWVCVCFGCFACLCVCVRLRACGCGLWFVFVVLCLCVFACLWLCFRFATRGLCLCLCLFVGCEQVGGIQACVRFWCLQDSKRMYADLDLVGWILSARLGITPGTTTTRIQTRLVIRGGGGTGAEEKPIQAAALQEGKALSVELGFDMALPISTLSRKGEAAVSPGHRGAFAFGISASLP